ncbi:MAG: N-acetylmuramoyl-L-alanine amidase [Acidobacteria bacterium]|nr:N-acetylmuramoyl-L-alanine amidase [Acidobacteriota bacterium]
MRRIQIILIALVLGTGLLAAQEYNQTFEFHFEDRAIVVPKFGPKVEVLPVLELIGAEPGFSPAAGTYGVLRDDHVIQFAVDHKVLLVDGELREAREAPVASPRGVAASLSYLERWLLSPLGFHLEPIPRGYRIVPGARFAEPIGVRPVAADFEATTTLVLTLNRPAEVDVEEMPPGVITVRFEDGSPQLDSSFRFSSQRVTSLTSSDQDIFIRLASGAGLTSWHPLENPPRITFEIGAARPTPVPAQARAPVVRPTGPRPVVIDPGHGGDDVGAQSPEGLLEKDVTLAIGRQLARILENRGHSVRLTRDGDQSRVLTDRTAFANRLEAPAFISLHANASTFTSATGAETYFMSLDGASDEAAAATADLENRAGSLPEDLTSLDLILWDLAQAEVLNESAELALAIQGRLNARLGTRDRGVKQAPFVVLKGATMPAVLVEIGFLSNRTEAERLTSPEYQQQLAEAIAIGIEDFLRR